MEDDGDDKQATDFHDMGLDDRLLKAIAKLGWSKPTPIQEKAIPLALDGKDILSRARTGSGKTAAYIIPIIQRILHLKKLNDDLEQEVRALVLVPSRELSSQACNMVQELAAYCSRHVSCVDVSSQSTTELLRPILSGRPDIVVGTPSRVLAHIQAETFQISKSMQWLVIDEADLLFSFGYEDDLKKLTPHLSSNYQAFLMSATLSEDIESLKKLLLHNPVNLNLSEESPLALSSQLTQYHVLSESEDDKYLLIYALLKLKLIRGKSILFVNSIDRCYRLKLFLEQFSIFSSVMNSELPLNSRCHVVEQFNQGLYDYIIATDESSLIESVSSTNKVEESKKTAKHKKKKVAKSKEYGISRGIDFKNVSNVINFDFPVSVENYVHRVGRTARGDARGTALSFVLPAELEALNEAQRQLSGGAEDDEDQALKPYQFKMDEIEGLRYRCKDAIRAVTKTSVREARVKELRREMLNSEKLRTYFEDNPNDLQVLRHDSVAKPKKIAAHMKNIPEYLIPATLKGMYTGKTVTSHSTQKHAPPSHDVKRKRPGGKRMGKPNPKYKKHHADPLRTFKPS